MLLTMIKEAKIDIRDIFISDITNQFVTYVQNLPEKDYEYMAEYIAMAATLIAIKSAKFLPKANFDEEIDILEQDEENLYLRIEAYKNSKKPPKNCKPWKRCIGFIANRNLPKRISER